MVDRYQKIRTKRKTEELNINWSCLVLYQTISIILSYLGGVLTPTVHTIRTYAEVPSQDQHKMQKRCSPKTLFAPAP